jgi:hypothetical protein
MTPQRIQLSRKAGFNLKNESTKLNGLLCVVVSRPHHWGNPYVVGKDGNAAECVQKFRKLIMSALWLSPSLAELRGKNLACFCKLNRPCHADVLLELANA